jgi:hypothetical protein
MWKKMVYIRKLHRTGIDFDIIETIKAFTFLVAVQSIPAAGNCLMLTHAGVHQHIDFPTLKLTVSKYLSSIFPDLLRKY